MAKFKRATLLWWALGTSADGTNKGFEQGATSLAVVVSLSTESRLIIILISQTALYWVP